MTDLNPHHEQMADESMVRTLDAQARAIWPQERELVRRYGLPDDVRILDAGCGTGEAAARFAGMFPRATILGVDVIDASLERARETCAEFGPRVSFEHRSVYELGLPERSFDLVLNRHVTHSIPDAKRVYGELARATRRGGRLHLIPEDYDMLFFERVAPDPREFWHEAPMKFGERTGTDLFVGRHTYRHLVELGLEDITVDYVVVDTLRVPRETFAQILTAWRDGYTKVTAEVTRFSEAQATAYFDRMIANIRDPKGYASWLVPVVSARVP